jgi:hypothetical protein
MLYLFKYFHMKQCIYYAKIPATEKYVHNVANNWEKKCVFELLLFK